MDASKASAAAAAASPAAAASSPASAAAASPAAAAASAPPSGNVHAAGLRHLDTAAPTTPSDGAAAPTPSFVRQEEAQELKAWEEQQLKAAAEAEAARVRGAAAGS